MCHHMVLLTVPYFGDIFVGEKSHALVYCGTWHEGTINLYGALMQQCVRDLKKANSG